jgi:tight adherence protein C
MNFESYLPAGVTPEDVLILMSALSAGSIALAVWIGLLYRDPAAKRAQIIALQRNEMRAGVIGPRRRQERLPTIGMMRKVVDRLNLLRSGQAHKISLKLMRAGWRSKDAIIRYLFSKLALPFAFGGTAVFLLHGLDLYGLNTTQKLLATLVSVIAGAYAPEIYIRNAAKKRCDQIRKALPDALDLMVICAEAGLSLDATLMRVSQEMEQAAPELADEFSLTGLELGFLSDRRKALQNLALRVDLSAMRGVANTLMQAERYGTPLSQSLRVMAGESRQERMMRAEEKAARLPAQLTVPMIVFILPPLFIVLLGRAILNTMDAFRGLSF